jgi:glycosyltransferase involved in cell wall biosynthesis
MKPKVSFVVPCYKLAHLLPECVNSILMQTYENFEVLIMDDCSPDNTPEIARRFTDKRVRHIRNEINLGHLRNYNKGISVATGEYIWLISADDRLRVPHALERYTQLMDKYPRVGYACCPGVPVINGKEASVAEYSILAERDSIFEGHNFLKRLLHANYVVAASGMVRRQCYERYGCFPLDLPYAGDWYLWCLFALHYDVAYFAEPMVNCTHHERSMTNSLSKEDIRICINDDVAVLWRIMDLVSATGNKSLLRYCQKAIACEYARHIMHTKYTKAAYSMSLEELERSLSSFATSPTQKEWLTLRTYSSCGDLCFQHGNVDLARRYYDSCLKQNPFVPTIVIKRFLLSAGVIGYRLRRLAREWRAELAAYTHRDRPEVR